MKKEAALEKINGSENVEFEVFTSEEHTTYLDNFKKQEVDAGVKDATSQIHKRYDDDMFEMFGERKEADEKTYNFLKRKVSDLKEQTGESEQLKTKITELELAVKNNTGDELLKRDLDEARKQYKEDKEKWDGKEKEYLSNLETHKLDTALDKAMIGLKFKDDIPEDIKDVFIGKVKADLLKKARFVEDRLVFIGDDNKTLVNKTDLNPLTAKEMMSEGLESVLAKVDKQNGLPKPKTKVVDGKEVLDLPDPGAKNREEVSKYLIESGIPRSSKQYMEYYKEFTKDLKKLT